MNHYIFWGIIAAVFVLQVLLCMKGKGKLLKWLPTLLLLAAEFACAGCYLASGCTNWAFLILMLLLLGPLAAVGVGWLAYLLLRKK